MSKKLRHGDAKVHIYFEGFNGKLFPCPSLRFFVDNIVDKLIEKTIHRCILVTDANTVFVYIKGTDSDYIKRFALAGVGTGYHVIETRFDSSTITEYWGSLLRNNDCIIDLGLISDAY